MFRERKKKILENEEVEKMFMIKIEGTNKPKRYVNCENRWVKVNLTRNEINQKLSIIYHFSRENDAFPLIFFTLHLSLSLFTDRLILDDIGRFCLGTATFS